jgi:hypothetical protein
VAKKPNLDDRRELADFFNMIKNEAGGWCPLSGKPEIKPEGFAKLAKSIGFLGAGF